VATCTFDLDGDDTNEEGGCLPSTVSEIYHTPNKVTASFNPLLLVCVYECMYVYVCAYALANRSPYTLHRILVLVRTLALPFLVLVSVEYSNLNHCSFLARVTEHLLRYILVLDLGPVTNENVQFLERLLRVLKSSQATDIPQVWI